MNAHAGGLASSLSLSLSLDCSTSVFHWDVALTLGHWPNAQIHIDAVSNLVKHGTAGGYSRVCGFLYCDAQVRLALEHALHSSKHIDSSK
jgi:hypothetical protein